MINNKIITNKTKILIFLIIVILSGILVVSANTKTVTINTRVVVTNIQPQPETSISGYVINNANNRGLSGWTVELFGFSKDGINFKFISERTTTNSIGFYKFNSLSEGTYFIILQIKPMYIPLTLSVLQIKLSANQKSENNNFTVLNIDDYMQQVMNNHQFI